MGTASESIDGPCSDRGASLSRTRALENGNTLRVSQVLARALHSDSTRSGRGGPTVRGPASLVFVVARRLWAGDDAGKVALFAGFAGRPIARLSCAFGTALHLFLLMLASLFFLASLVERRTSSVCQGVTSLFAGRAGMATAAPRRKLQGWCGNKGKRATSNRRRPAWTGETTNSAISAKLKASCSQCVGS